MMFPLFLALVYSYLVGGFMYLGMWIYKNDGYPPESKEILSLTVQMLLWPIAYVYLVFRKEANE